MGFSSFFKGLILNPANSVEYVSNNTNLITAGGTAPLSNTDSPSGSPLLAYGSSTTGLQSTSFPVSFKQAIQSDDVITVELYNGTQWINAVNFAPYIDQATARYGIRTEITGANQVTVRFGNGGISSTNGTYGGAGSGWNNLVGFFWRVRKAKALAPAGVNNLVGAIVGPPKPVTITGSWTTNTTYSAMETQDGEYAEYDVLVSLSGTPNSTLLTLNLPAGRTINTAKLAASTNAYSLGVGSAFLASTGNIEIRVGYFSPTQVILVFSKTGGTALGSPIIFQGVDAASPAPFVSGSYAIVRFKIPVSEWSGNTNAVLSTTMNQEIAYNTDVTGTQNPGGNGGVTSTAYGPQGVAFSSNWATGTDWQRRVRFLTPIQPTDQLTLEINIGGQWLPMIERLYGFTRQAGTSYGPRIAAVTGSNTDVDVFFAEGGYAGSNTTYGGLGLAWSTLSAFSWRVRKFNPLAPTGIVQATADGDGTVRGGRVPGSPGSTILPGMIGEIISATGGGIGSGSFPGNTPANVAQMVLTGGNWEIFGSIRYDNSPAAPTLAADAFVGASISTTSATMNNSNADYRPAPTVASTGRTAATQATIVVPPGTTQTVYLVARTGYTASNGAVVQGIGGGTQFYAKRIG